MRRLATLQLEPVYTEYVHIHSTDEPLSFPALPDHGSATSPRGCTCARLRRLTRRVTAIYDRELAPVNLRVTQFSLLAALRRGHGAALGGEAAAEPGLPVTHLADLMDMDRTTLTRNLKPLVGAGLTDLFTDPADRRIHRARITPAGLQAFDAARPHWLAAQLLVNQILGEPTVAALHDWIERVTPSLRAP